MSSFLVNIFCTCCSNVERNPSYSLSSAEAPVSKHQRKKRERERWGEKTGARGTMRSQRSLRALIFPLPSLRAPRVYFSQGATVGGLCGGERRLIKIKLKKLVT